MDGRVSGTQLYLPLGNGRDHKYVHCVANKVNLALGWGRRQRQVLLGLSVLLIFCWMIASVFLISVRRGERSTEDVGEEQGTIAMLLPAEMLPSVYTFTTL